MKTEGKKQFFLLRGINKVWNTLGVWLVLILLFVVLAIASPKFMSGSNLINVIRQISVNAIVALGATFVVLAGEIDLSSGALATLSGCGCAILMMQVGIPVVPAILITLVVGILVGVVAGVVVTYVNVTAFIATLGLQYVFLGAVLLLTNSQPITGLPEAFLVLGRGYIGPIPVPSILMLALYLVGAFVLKYTMFGRNVIAVGENPVAANLSGVNVKLTKVVVFVIGGFASALGGIVLASRLSSGQPTSGGDISLQALAAVFVGGTSKGSVLNTLAGACIIGFINNGLNLLRVNSYWQNVVLGIIIVCAVALDNYRASKASGRSN